jgi:hypothetical protein
VGFLKRFLRSFFWLFFSLILGVGLLRAGQGELTGEAREQSGAVLARVEVQKAESRTELSAGTVTGEGRRSSVSGRKGGASAPPWKAPHPAFGHPLPPGERAGVRGAVAAGMKPLPSKPLQSVLQQPGNCWSVYSLPILKSETCRATVEARGLRRPFHPQASLATGESSESESRESWFERVSRTQSEQPRWITPLVTVTPRLEEEFRYDFLHQALPNGSTTTSYGGGKGLELIPSERVELIIGVPPYIAHDPDGRQNGVGDVSFLVKYRLLSANEQRGNYILTLFFGATAPTASKSNGPDEAIFTPTVALGKGWGAFDIQTTLGVGIPAGATHLLGTPVVHNIAFQYRVLRKLWPELEVNSTWWPNGDRTGKKQVFLTPGIVLGRLSLWKRLGLTVGAGVQLAVTDYRTYDRNLILSIRLPF